MGLLILAIGFILLLITFVSGIPTRFSQVTNREIFSTSTGHVSFEQSPISGISTREIQYPLGECKSLWDVNSPTTIKLLADVSGSYRLQASVSPCNSGVWIESGESLSLTKFQPVVLNNNRKTFCSFRLGLQEYPDRPVTVKFYSRNFTGFTNTKILYSSDRVSLWCPNGWLRYAQSIKILNAEGNPASNFIRLYSDNYAKVSLTLPEDDNDKNIRNGRDLVKLTRTDEPIIRSFKIYYD